MTDALLPLAAADAPWALALAAGAVLALAALAPRETLAAGLALLLRWLAGLLLGGAVLAAVAALLAGFAGGALVGALASAWAALTRSWLAWRFRP